MENFLLGPGFIDTPFTNPLSYGHVLLVWRNVKKYNGSSGTHNLLRETDG